MNARVGLALFYSYFFGSTFEIHFKFCLIILLFYCGSVETVDSDSDTYVGISATEVGIQT